MKNLCIALFFILLHLGVSATAEEISTEFFPITAETRCPVCGMFVGKYTEWVAQVRLSDGSAAAFDGIKDMMAYYFAPESFGAAKGAVVRDIAVKDYYYQTWSDGRKALYVLGSDVHGPMGHELVPFSSRDGAENFFEDHRGEKLLGFGEITPELVESLRKGHKMKGHAMPGMKK